MFSTDHVDASEFIKIIAVCWIGNLKA